ncbi:hypothetical protein [Streptomyces chartreusis]|uniref:hypothetical protein n=1 Tax=Streptomyces chartreusis TaxID=1969 RepID=UPI002E16C49E
MTAVAGLVVRRVLALPLAVIGLAPLAGCADLEGPRSTGTAPHIRSPIRLWAADRATAASRPAGGGADNVAVVPVLLPVLPSQAGDIRRLNATAVVKADLAASSRGPGAERRVDPAAVRAMARCTHACPVRAPQYHDLTGDGEAELITAVDTAGQPSELRVYSLTEGRLTRILSRQAALSAVSVTGEGCLLVSVPADAGYTETTAYSWDGRQLMHSVQSWDRLPPSEVNR